MAHRVINMQPPMRDMTVEVITSSLVTVSGVEAAGAGGEAAGEGGAPNAGDAMPCNYGSCATTGRSRAGGDSRHELLCARLGRQVPAQRRQ